MIKKLLFFVMALVLALPCVDAAAKAHFISKKSQVITASAHGLVNINKADSRALRHVKGIGPKKAEAIVAYRKSHGRFQSVADLTKVRGISVKRLAKIKSHLTV